MKLTSGFPYLTFGNDVRGDHLPILLSLLQLRRDQGGKIDGAVGITPLVIVP
jgi:hypothetical protein